MIKLALMLIVIGLCILAGVVALILLGLFIAAVCCKGIGETIGDIVNMIKRRES